MKYSRELKSNDAVPDTTNSWSVWELRIMVLTSLLVQAVLIVCGKKRKYKASAWLQVTVWLTYLAADWVATFALGILSKDKENLSLNPNFVIMGIWAPFLLVHLGGPDTITAYALEDNELWLRRITGSLGQLLVAVLVVYYTWNGSYVNFVTLPVMVAGLIKCGERVWSLWSGSTKEFRESILPRPDPGPNYAKFMDDCAAKKAEGHEVTLHIEGNPTWLDYFRAAITNTDIPDASCLHDGFYFFQIFEPLFADLILSFQDLQVSQKFFLKSLTWDKAFPVIEVELGLMYDMLYTKAKLMRTYPQLAISLKVVSFSCILSGLFAFCVLIDKRDMDVDRAVTLVLFTGAILLEIYSIAVFLSSSHAMFWLSKHKNWIVDLLYSFISILRTFFKLSHSKRWPNLISQFNLISFCLKDEPAKFIKFLKFFGIHKCCWGKPLYKWLQNSESFWKKRPQTINDTLKKHIFNQLEAKSNSLKLNIEECKTLCAQRGDCVLTFEGCNDRIIVDSIDKVEFDQSLLLWHIATDLCYYSDEAQNSDIENHIPSCKRSKLLSNYMLYLLVICPFMLPNGIGQIRFRDTCAEVNELLKERHISKRKEACRMIFSVNTDVSPSDVKGDRSKSVLFDACRLAKSLQSLETKEHWSKKRKWKMISKVWMEMLCHAASQCRGPVHAKQLSKGGEFLTHVWLLMAHLGITEQFQISRGHARAKLILK